MTPPEVPANRTLNVWLQEDGDPPRQLAHYVVLHEYGDPPDRTRLVVEQIGDVPKDEATRRKDYAWARPLAQACNAAGVLHARMDEVTFSLPLAEWLGENIERRRVFYYTGRWYRHDLFTDEDHRRLEAFEAERESWHRDTQQGERVGCKGSPL